MRLVLLLASISAFALSARADDVCNPPGFQGPYGFELTGETTISGQPKPATSLGRLVFDGSGGVSGTSSAMYTGLLLGNPVTGTYQAHTDCTVSWSLQDDSGAYQHFSGVATPDNIRVRFRQTDPGGPQDGLLVRISEQDCKLSSLRNKYTFSLSGSTISMNEAGPSRSVKAKGVMDQDAGHNFQLTLEDHAGASDVTITVESDCTVELGLELPLGATATPIQLRGVLVDAAKQILAIQTDPGAMVSARFTAP